MYKKEPILGAQLSCLKGVGRDDTSPRGRVHAGRIPNSRPIKGLTKEHFHLYLVIEAGQKTMIVAPH
eukprot:1145270-Pelagomonas_calceolata.AAC.1